MISEQVAESRAVHPYHSVAMKEEPEIKGQNGSNMKMNGIPCCLEVITLITHGALRIKNSTSCIFSQVEASANSRVIM